MAITAVGKELEKRETDTSLWPAGFAAEVGATW